MKRWDTYVTIENGVPKLTLSGHYEQSLQSHFERESFNCLSNLTDADIFSLIDLLQRQRDEMKKLKAFLLESK